MGLGTSIVLIAVGAILRYAVTVEVAGVDIQVVGTILLVIGILGLVIALVYMFMSARQDRYGGGYDQAPAPRDRYRDR